MTESLQEAMRTSSDDRFTITDDGGVVWALGKLNEIEEQRQNAAGMVAEAIKRPQQEIEQANDWLARRNQELDDSANYFRGLIQEYTDQKHVNDPKYKLKTPKGTITYTRKSVQFEHSNAAIMKYIGDEYIKIKETKSLDWAKLKKAIKSFPTTDDNQVVNPETGEIMVGIKAKPAHEEFTIKPNKEE